MGGPHGQNLSHVQELGDEYVDLVSGIAVGWFNVRQKRLLATGNYPGTPTPLLPVKNMAMMPLIQARVLVDGLRMSSCRPSTPILSAAHDRHHEASQLTQADLDKAAHSLNGRPRQTLNWMTPSEKLGEVLQ